MPLPFVTLSPPSLFHLPPHVDCQIPPPPTPQNTALDLDQAENLDLVENWLYALMKLPSTVDGCTMVMKQRSVKVTCRRRRSWTFLCSHDIIMREIQVSHFSPNSVGKVNVPLQSIKHTNSKGASIRGNYIFFVFCFYFFQSYLS